MYMLASLAGLLIFFICLKELSTARRRRSLPPGPAGLPLVGNTFDWDMHEIWFTFTKWAQTYGDLVYAKVLGNEFIIINSFDTAKALLHGKGAQYSDRAPQHFITNMAGWGSFFILQSDGPEVHEQRRMFAKGLGTRKALEVFDSRMEKWVAQFAQKMLEESRPDRVSELAHWLSGVTILDVTYGYKISNQNEDELLALAKQILIDWNVGIAPGAHLVDTLPWLEYLPAWLPGMGFQETAAGMRKRWNRFSQWAFDFAVDQQRKGMAIPSVVSAHLEDKDLTPAKQSSLKWSTAGMYLGGTDTTSAAVCYFVLFMVQYPDVQARAQAEIDALLGGTRLPTARDMDVLPYVSALISEVLRFGIVTPHGLVHQAREDDSCEGFFIPKGAQLLANIYFMSRDPRNHSNPDVFNPERFLGEKPELDPRNYVFGFGKRICPGRVFADYSLFLVVATCLSTMTFLRAKDQDGKEIVPKGNWGGASITLPEPFPYRAVPRSEQSVTLLHNADT